MSKNKKLAMTLRLYDPLWKNTKGKSATLGSTAVLPDPATYRPIKKSGSKPATFQNEKTNRL